MLPLHHRGLLRVLVFYDGSADADAAVELTASTFPGAQAKVLSVWDPSIAGGEQPEEATQQLARRAAEHARELGLHAEPRCQTDAADVSRAIVETAAREHADLIVTGRRGLADDRSPSRGSVVRDVLRRADRPVLVVPSVQSATPPRAAVPAVPDGGLRIQVVPLEDV
jgi:nucleotide-binding universal stress UspA family protein